MKLNEEQRKELERAAIPLMQFLSNPKLFHPHVTTTVDSERIILYEGVCSIPYDPPLFFLCRCGEEIEGSKDTDEHQIVCPKCRRRGRVEQQAF